MYCMYRHINTSACVHIIYIHNIIHINIYRDMYRHCTHTHTPTNRCTRVQVNTYKGVCVYMYLYIYREREIYAHTQTHANLGMYMCTHIHVYVYTHDCICFEHVSEHLCQICMIMHLDNTSAHMCLRMRTYKHMHRHGPTRMRVSLNYTGPKMGAICKGTHVVI